MSARLKATCHSVSLGADCGGYGWRAAQVAEAGGNSIRLWIFVYGDDIPIFESGGFVTATDKTHSLIFDLK